MDLSTSHTAYTLHAQQAQRMAQEQERQRVMQERAAERSDGVVDVPVTRRHRGIALLSILRGHRAAAQ
jgi:hypothetical protein